jgi:perosamine synthetase
MIPVNEPLLAGRELDYVTECVRSGWISSSGQFVERFERDWALYCGARYGVAVANGTAALQVAVDALGLEPGDEVILPSLTIISCALAVVRAGGTPVVVDCDPETYVIDPDAVEGAISPRTRAIMPVHMYGHPADMDAIARLASGRGIAVVEDAAQAHGCEYRSRDGWRRCGSLGRLAAFSFFANKLVTTGEGGMVLTDDADLAEKCRSLRNLAFQQRRFLHEELGHNFRLTNMQAAVGVAQIERMDEILARKRRMGALYDEALSGIAKIRTPVQREWARVNYWMYTLVLKDDADIDAAELARSLRSRGIETRPFFLGMHEQPVFHRMGLLRGMKLPVTERLSRRGLYLPSGLSLSEDQIAIVADAVRESLK